MSCNCNKNCNCTECVSGSDLSLTPEMVAMAGKGMEIINGQTPASDAPTNLDDYFDTISKDNPFIVGGYDDTQKVKVSDAGQWSVGMCIAVFSRSDLKYSFHKITAIDTETSELSIQNIRVSDEEAAPGQTIAPEVAILPVFPCPLELENSVCLANYFQAAETFTVPNDDSVKEICIRHASEPTRCISLQVGFLLTFVTQDGGSATLKIVGDGSESPECPNGGSRFQVTLDSRSYGTLTNGSTQKVVLGQGAYLSSGSGSINNRLCLVADMTTDLQMVANVVQEVTGWNTPDVNDFTGIASIDLNTMAFTVGAGGDGYYELSSFFKVTAESTSLDDTPFGDFGWCKNNTAQTLVWSSGTLYPASTMIVKLVEGDIVKPYHRTNTDPYNRTDYINIVKVSVKFIESL